MYETNSSAVHSIVLTGPLEPNQIPVTTRGNIHVHLHYYGKDYAVYKTQQEKLDYLATIAAYKAGDYVQVPTEEQCEESYDYDNLCEAIRSYVPEFKGRLILHVPKGEEWGFDHQVIDDWPVALWNQKEVVRFIWNPNITLVTDCD